ncbi:MAG: hypothetical protein LBU56_04690 [Rickettsiales bacterium]|nr:hypothetical protein [Rickettsiales bacterium]
MERRNLPKLEGKVWNMGEIRKRDPSLIKRDFDKACDEMTKKLNKWGSRKFT